jgi:predicted ribosome quality control (RQC) complex YloA/Tae2 family protein
VSNPIRFDALLVRALAGELRARLADRAAHPLPVFDSDRSVVLGVKGGSLRWELHPARGWLCSGAALEGEPSARVVRVAAPADERLLRIELLEGSRFRGARRSLVFELHTNQWNALVVDGVSGRIVSVLRAREAGGRSLVAGAEYAAPSPPGRISPDDDGARQVWASVLGPVPAAERGGVLVRRFAWTSPLNAGTILGDAAREQGEAALDSAFLRWRAMAAGEGVGTFLLRGPKGVQPYPYPLDGWEALPRGSILEAMEEIGSAGGADEARDPAAELLPEARGRLRAVERRIASLEGELAKAGEAERLRGTGDLILAHLHRVHAGMERIALPAFDGAGEVEVALDPALRPHENADRYYAEARRRARAEARVPELIAAAVAEGERWSAAIARLEAGETPAWVPDALRRASVQSRQTSTPAERLPYRPYRTSGGLEVRVGKTSKDNDRLTFHHASPGDVWLHARSVPGSHVVLRWTSPDAPPARDLEEAAVLAALYSKARTSGTVAVDWTRRKHVRKPRGAPPGRVSLLNAKTVFVEPDAAVEERMRVG